MENIQIWFDGRGLSNTEMTVTIDTSEVGAILDPKDKHFGGYLFAALLSGANKFMVM